MLALPAMVMVQFIFAPFDSDPLVWKLCHDPEEFVANVAVRVCAGVFTSFMVTPTAGFSRCAVDVSLVGCSPVAVGHVLLKVVLNLYV